MPLLDVSSRSGTLLAHPVGQAVARTVNVQMEPGNLVPTQRHEWDTYEQHYGIVVPSAPLCASDVSSTISHSLANAFASLLPGDPRVERVYWHFDGETFKVWTVIDTPDDQVEHPIYAAQVAFMEKFSDLDCDFVVIYRFGKPIEHLRPTGVKELRLRA